uniref:Uncharacterized protein n=1 Tax=Spongospora subterranea TaxID=70186 RepID=A0A0H5QI10_9EUKA|eukprot:CRZ01613.1 hypothetical protein [Spongospora subterranea]
MCNPSPVTNVQLYITVLAKTDIGFRRSPPDRPEKRQWPIIIALDNQSTLLIIISELNSLFNMSRFPAKVPNALSSLPPVPSFKGGHVDTPAEPSRTQARTFSSPQRLKVQAAAEKVQNLQQRLKASANEKELQLTAVEKILSGESSSNTEEAEDALLQALSGLAGPTLRKRSDIWCRLSSLAQRKGQLERAASYLQQATIFKAQPVDAINQALKNLYLECGGTISDLLVPPDNNTSQLEPREATPVLTPITKKLQSKLRHEDDSEATNDDRCQTNFGTPRAGKLSLLKQIPSQRYEEQDTPSPTSVPIVQLSAMLEKAYIEQPPLPIVTKFVKQETSFNCEQQNTDQYAIRRLNDHDSVPSLARDIDDILDDFVAPSTAFSNAQSLNSQTKQPATQPSYRAVRIKPEHAITPITELTQQLEGKLAFPISQSDIASSSKPKPTGTAIVIENVGRGGRLDVASPVRRTFRRLDHGQTAEEADAVLAECQYEFKPNVHLTPLRPAKVQTIQRENVDPLDDGAPMVNKDLTSVRRSRRLSEKQTLH